MRLFGGLEHLLISGAAPAVADVFHQRAVKEYRLLRDKRDCVAQGVLRHFDDILPVYFYFAPFDIIKPEQKFSHCGLARARGSDKRHALPARNRKIKIIKHRCSVVKAEGDIVKPHLAFWYRQFFSIFFVFDAVRGLQNRHHFAGIGKCVIKTAELKAYGHQLIKYGQQIRLYKYKISQRKLAVAPKDYRTPHKSDLYGNHKNADAKPHPSVKKPIAHRFGAPVGHHPAQAVRLVLRTRKERDGRLVGDSIGKRSGDFGVGLRARGTHRLAQTRDKYLKPDKEHAPNTQRRPKPVIAHKKHRDRAKHKERRRIKLNQYVVGDSFERADIAADFVRQRTGKV